MSMPFQDALNSLSTPVWIVLPEDEEILFANRAASEMSGDLRLDRLRQGSLSACAEEQLSDYIPGLLAKEHVVEIWTMQKEGKAVPLSCRLSLLRLENREPAILVEGISTAELPVSALAPPVGRLPCSAEECPNERGFYERLFQINTAPMLLIDPADDGRIVDANQAACRFYGYPRQEFCRKHTWEINSMGRDVLPVMHEVARLPGGHKPLNFVHVLADGSQRDVQTYAGPVELDGKRLMLCIIHDITEQKRLKKELERAALSDPLTGLWNRRQFLHLVEHARAQSQRYETHFSLMLVDADHFKAINDQYGHAAGDEVLLLLARTLEARVRESDAVCRWGGEEFVVLLPQTDLESAEHLAQSLRQTIEQNQRPDLPRITVSIGVAEHQGDESIEKVLKRADEALYRAKAAGRNQVAVA